MIPTAVDAMNDETKAGIVMNDMSEVDDVLSDVT